MEASTSTPEPAQPSQPPSGDSLEERRESCVPMFDALWFCYTPGHQMKQYYVHGNVDDCSGHWSAFYACLKKKTKYKDEVEEDPMKGKHPLWQLRTPAEARQAWEQEFGQGAPGEGVAGAAGSSRGRAETLV